METENQVEFTYFVFVVLPKAYDSISLGKLWQNNQYQNNLNRCS